MKSRRPAVTSDPAPRLWNGFWIALTFVEENEDDYTRPFVTTDPWERPERDYEPRRSPSPAERAQRSRSDPPKPQGHRFGKDLVCDHCGDVSWTQHQRAPAPCSRRTEVAKAADIATQARKARAKYLREQAEYREALRQERFERSYAKYQAEKRAKAAAYPLTLRQRALQNMIELAIWDSVGAPGLRFHVDLKKQREQCKPTTNEEKHQ